MKKRSFSWLLPFFGALWCAGASAEPVADFYRHRTVTIVVGGSAGGGYDTLARLVAKFMGEHIPGHPDVIVQNMPGAGGIVSMNYIAFSAEIGTVIASPNNNTPFRTPLWHRRSEIRSSEAELAGIAKSGNEPVDPLALRARRNSIAEAQTHELRMGASGANSTPAFYAKLLNETLGLKLKLIVGFPGQNDALLAMERGEIDGYPSAFYSSLMSTRPTWIAEKKVKLLVQLGAGAAEGAAGRSVRPGPDDKSR